MEDVVDVEVVRDVVVGAEVGPARYLVARVVGDAVEDAAAVAAAAAVDKCDVHMLGGYRSLT